jgi:predicted RNA-binding protein with PUA-like domain
LGYFVRAYFRLFDVDSVVAEAERYSMNYWLMKSEPDVYSIADLKGDRTSIWDGVRNYQARNFMREMSRGDLVFFYHSNTKIPGIVGLVRVVETGIADPSQFDMNSEYYDPKSPFDAPRWQTVRVEFVEEFAKLISLDELKQKFSGEERQSVIGDAGI